MCSLPDVIRFIFCCFSLLVAIPPRRLTDESNSEYVVLPRKGEVDEEWMPSGTRRDRKDKRKSKKERKKSFVGIKVNNLNNSSYTCTCTMYMYNITM